MDDRAVHRVTLGAALGAAILASFAVCLGRSPFVAGPDTPAQLALLSHWRHLPAIFSRDFLMFTEGQYRPVSYAVLALARSLVGADQALVWHLGLLLCHWLNALLVAAIAWRLGAGRWGAALAGLAFALHPLACVVANDLALFHHLLGLTFLLAGLWAYLHLEDGARWYGLAVVLFACGLLVSKVVVVLPLLLLAWEALHQRTPWRYVAARLAGFAVPGVALAPLFWLLRPHPLHYAYTDYGPGAGWFSFFSVVGATQWYGPGLLLGHGIPALLHQTVVQVFTPASLRFVAWAAVDAVALAAALVLLWRRRWAGLGLCLVLVPLLPYATTRWNAVDDYVAWEYLYPATAGLALLVGAVAFAAPGGRSLGRRVLPGALAAAVVLLACQQVYLNAAYRSPVAYWSRARARGPSSETASVCLGRAHLELGKLEPALAALYAPQVRELSASSEALSRHFAHAGDLVAAAVHLRMAMRTTMGLQFAHSEPLIAEVMLAAGALDHAEAALGKVLTANPYDTQAMVELATVWTAKGYVRATRALRERLRQLDPHSPRLRAVDALLSEREALLGRQPESVVPPSPSWLRYATQGFYHPETQRQIVLAALRLPDDPAVQLEAGTCLVRQGEERAGLERFRRVTDAIPSSALAWALRSWAATEAGEYAEAQRAGERALQLDDDSATVHNTLGILYALMARQRPGNQELRTRATHHFREALRISPNHVSARINVARGMAEDGRLDQAIRAFQEVLKLQPDAAEAHLALGNALADKGEVSEAIRAYARALESRPDYPEACHNLGTVLVQQGQTAQAEQCFRRALAIQPDFARSRDGLAVLLMGSRRFAEAAVLLREGLRLTPGHTRGALLLASLLTSCPDSRVRDPGAAAQIAERVSKALGHAHPEALLVWADALAASGSVDRARATARRALDLAGERGVPEVEARARQRLAAYEKGPPRP
ncbi:MAG: tetratricopeptide repeat protein [Candidatus Latescibacterota bacterium]